MYLVALAANIKLFMVLLLLYSTQCFSDFNNDNVIDEEDVDKAVKMLCGGGEETMEEDDILAIVSHVIREADVRRIGVIGPQEFRNMMTKSSDFSTNFTLRL